MTTGTDRFEANAIQLSKLISEVKGFYIPEYQRPYTWTEENVIRLFETIENAIENAVKEPYFAFLGAILALDDPMELEATYGIKRDESPSTVYALIDGQQRITSLVLLLGEIYRKLEIIKKESHRLPFDEYNGKLNGAINELKAALFVRNDWIEEKIVYLPKIINGRDNDKWLKSNDGVYKSLIARYLVELSKNYNSQPDDEKLKVLTTKMRELITDFSEDNDLLEKVCGTIEAQERLLARPIPNQILEILNGNDHEKKKDFRELILLLILEKFILDNVRFAQIRVNKESFAFDIFDSLNSTGDPLTAFETFKPLVIRNLTQESFEKSDEKLYLEKFGNFLNEKDKQERHTITKKFIVSLAMYENGQEVNETLNQQRTYLRDYYKNNTERRKEFCRSISLLTDFYDDIWSTPISEIDNKISEEAKIGISVLTKTRHTVTIPILARYYTNFVLDKPETEKDYSSFNNVVKAVTTFSLFWRLLNAGSTAGIDDIYKKLLTEKVSRIKGISTVDELRKHFKKLLDNFVGHTFDKDDFVAKISNAQYASSRNNTWIKFLIVGAMHDSIADSNEKGLDKKGSPNSNPTLTVKKWEAVNDPLTLEHIAPQRPENPDKWDKALLLPDYLHSIGNLTLLPKQQNSIAGNRDWEIKSKIYSILADNDLENRYNLMLSISEEYGLYLSKSTKKILKEANFWLGLKAISNLTKWTPEIIEKRAKKLAGLAWDNLSPWLGY